MAESPIERLKRLAREKKEAAASVTQPVVATVMQKIDELVVLETELAILKLQANPATGEAGALAAVDAQLAALSKQVEETSHERTGRDSPTGTSAEAGEGASKPLEGTSNEGELNAIQPGDTKIPEGGGTNQESNLATTSQADTSVTVHGPTSNSTHPLAMEFAEMEAALLSKDPNFKMILRQIHRHLATDPDLVTQMSEAEIQSVVSGLVVIANAEVVEPAKAKTVKAAVAKAKKVTISVDDL